MSAPAKPTRRALPSRAQARARISSGNVAAQFGAVEGMRQVAVSEIRANPDQPRKRFESRPLQQLADSIAQRGLLQPLLLRPLADGAGYELVAGERRWRAARMAGVERVPALIRESPDDTAALDALIENVHREDLTVVEEARAIASMLKDLGASQADLADRLGRSRTDLAHTVRLLDLPDDVLDLLDRGELSKGHGKALLTEPDHYRRRTLAREAARDGCSVRELERRIADGTAPRRPSRERADADQAALGRTIAERIESRVPWPVKVRPKGAGFTVQLTASSAEEAEAIARAFGA